MTGLSKDKINSIRSLIAPEAGDDAVLVPVSDLRALLDAADEAHRLKLVLEEVGMRNRQQADRVRDARDLLSFALRATQMDPADAHVPDSVYDLIGSQKWIQAIKVLRDLNPGLGLGDAKGIVDRIRYAS